MKQTDSGSTRYNHLKLTLNHKETFNAFLELQEQEKLTDETKARLKLTCGFEPSEQEIKDCVQTPGFFSNQFMLLIAMEELIENGHMGNETKAWYKETYGYLPSDQDLKEFIEKNKN